METIKIEHLSKSYSEVAALRDISLDVREKEIFGVIGPDGAGKTTLFRIIATLLLPDKGKVTVLGLDVIRDYRKIRNITGYMPGRFSLYHDLTVKENLNFYARVFGTNVEENYDLIDTVYKQLKPFKNRRAGALSGGMKQKLALSCALIHRPEILILDEPTTGVDAVSRQEFWDLLDEIRNMGISILVSTPYMDEASRCDRIALMQKGEILATDAPEKISDAFDHELFSVLTEKENFRLLNELRSLPFVYSAWLFGQDIHVSTTRNADSKSSLLKYLESKEYRVQYKKISPGIEDTFIHLMKYQSDAG